MPAIMTDHALATLLAQRDPAALEQLYQHRRSLEAVLYRRFGTQIAAEDRTDIVADTLLHAWHAAARYDPCLSSVKAWLIMLTTYQAREFLRRSNQGRTTSLEYVADRLPANDREPRREEGRPGTLIARLLARLPVRRARVIEMFYYEAQPTSEIARSLGISEAAVRSHLSHGRASLRRELELEPAGA